MKYLLSAFVVLIFQVQSFAQISAQTDWELGATAGFSWYNGDLNTSTMFGRNYMNKSFGIIVRKNINQRWALRFEGNYGALNADDSWSLDAFQRARNLNFQTKLYEVAGGIEFNFLEFDALSRKYKFSPYSFIELGVFHFNPETYVEGNVYKLRPLMTENKAYKLTNVCIPFGFGMKVAPSDRIILGLEWGMRKTYSDYIDDVSDMYPKAGELTGLSENLSDRSLYQSGPDGTNWGTMRGNARTKDWYSIVKASVSIRIGPKKGSCKHLKI